jgi:hypothetical protein
MNIKAFAEKARLCLRSEGMVAEILARSYARKLALSCLAVLTTSMGLVFLNVALFTYLQSIWGPVWTPLAIGVGNLVLAGFAIGLATVVKPGSELEVAKDLRKLSINTLEDELQSSQIANGVFGTLTGANNSNVAKLLLPAVISIVGALRKKRTKA